MAAAHKEPSRADVRMGELRRALAAAGEAEARARLRVRLADLLRQHGRVGEAHAELLEAAKQGGHLPGVRLALLAAARALPGAEGADLLARAADGGGSGSDPPTIFIESAALMLANAGEHDRATALWLRVAGVDTLPDDRRERAARAAAEAARRARRPKDELAALRLRIRFGMAGAAARPALLHRAAALAGKSGAEPGGSDGAGPGGAGALTRDRGRRAAAGAVPRAADPAAAAEPGDVGPPDPPTAPVAPPTSPSPGQQLELALAAARAGEGRRARRLAEDACRLGAAGPEAVARLQAIGAALRESGLVEDALRLRRTELEGRSDAVLRQGLEALATEAAAAGLPVLCAELRLDQAWLPVLPGAAAVVRDAPAVSPETGGAATPTADASSTPATPADLFLAVQRELARLPPDADPSFVLPRLQAALSGHSGADAAVALGERILARTAGPQALIDWLAVASAAEREPVRRLRLTQRLAERLAAAGDRESAAVQIEQALELLTTTDSRPLRQQRADLLRRMGKDRELAAALERDAAVLRSPERTAVLAERAALLDAAGEEDRALDVRLEALRDAPADLDLLAAARRRLGETGRERESLRLALAAAQAHPPLPADERARLWRDVAALREGEGNLVEAAEAWEQALAVHPDADDAAAEAERLWMAIGEWRRVTQLLGRRASRQTDPVERARVLWRLAELRRTRLGDLDEAVRLYRELVELAPRRKGAAPLVASLSLRGEVWDDMVALHATRAAVAPTPADQARALLDRAQLLMQRPERVSQASEDLARAMDLDPRNAEIVSTLERLHEATGDWDSLGNLFRRRAEGLPEAEAARLFFGAGRVEERLGRPGAARKAYERAQRLDQTFREPCTALRMLASSRSDWGEVARLLEVEEKLAAGSERARLLGELGVVLAGRLGQAARATEVLEAATALDPDDLPSLESLTDLYLDAGDWEKAAAVMDRLVSAGETLRDAVLRYHRLGAMAEAAGQPDKALAFYARGYAKDSGHRLTLERLSDLCFDRGQWDNAWKATEGLLDRYASDLDAEAVVALCVRSALSDVHLAQRIGAAARLAQILGYGRGWDGGVRDVAESWAAMRLEPRLLQALEGERRQRVTARVAQALTVDPAHPVALQISTALAILDERWTDAVAGLDKLAGAPSFADDERSRFLEAAGDILSFRKFDRAGGQDAYRRAAALRPTDEVLAGKIDDNTAANAVALDTTDEIKL